MVFGRFGWRSRYLNKIYFLIFFTLSIISFSFIAVEFDPFLRQYFEDFKYSSLDSFEFKKYFLDYFNGKGVSGLDKIDWDDWFFSTGTPKYKPDYDYSLAKVRFFM